MQAVFDTLKQSETFKFDLVYILPEKEYSINNFSVRYIYGFKYQFKTIDSEDIEKLRSCVVTIHKLGKIVNFELQSFDKEGVCIVSVNRPETRPFGILPSTLDHFNFREVANYLLDNILFQKILTPNFLSNIDLTYIETSYV